MNPLSILIASVVDCNRECSAQFKGNKINFRSRLQDAPVFQCIALIDLDLITSTFCPIMLAIHISCMLPYIFHPPKWKIGKGRAYSQSTLALIYIHRFHSSDSCKSSYWVKGSMHVLNFSLQVGGRGEEKVGNGNFKIKRTEHLTQEPCSHLN